MIVLDIDNTNAVSLASLVISTFTVHKQENKTVHAFLMSYLKKSDNVIKKLITIQKLEPRPVGFKPNNLQLGMHMSACGQDTRM